MVDAPYQYGSNIRKRLLQGHILKKIILESSECKFILVVKESELVSNDGLIFIELLGEYVKMFKDFDQVPGLASALTVLVSLGNMDTPQIASVIRKLEDEFSKENNDDVIN